jgi:serine/threonine protein kinase
MSSSSSTTTTGQQQQPVSNGDSRNKFAQKRAKLKRRSTSTMPAALSSHANANRSSRPSSSHHSGHTTSSSSASGGRRHSRASQSGGGSSGGRRRGSSQPQEMCLSKEDLVELEVIGRGQNGLVRKAVHLPTLTRVALKSMDVYEKSTRHQLLHELHAYSGLNSPYLISFLGAYHDSGRIFLASEYMDCGSLSHFIHRCGGRLRDEALIKHVAAQCLAGLAYLHASHRIHRDIKPDNLLLHHSGSVKVGDFGLMVSVDPSNPCTSEFLGTLAYLSPERLQSCDYSFGADVWSLGVSLILAATGQLPVVGADFWEFISAMERNPPSLANTIATMRDGGYDKSNKAQQDGQGKKSDNVAASLGEHEIPPVSGEDSNGGAAAVPDDGSLEFSPAFHDFIDRMLVMDPSHRWSAEQLLSHPFLADVTDTSVTHAYAWQHEHVAQQNQRDLDVILDLLANRQITKLADAEHRRIRAGSGEDPNVGAPIPSHARTPGHAVTQPSFAYPPAVAAAASAAASANVNAQVDATADAAAPPSLQVSISPHLRVGGGGGATNSLSSSSSSSSSLSRSPGDGGPASTTSATSSLGSTASLDMRLSAECCGLTLTLQQSSSPATNLHSAGSNISADSMFSPSTCSSASSTSHASSTSSLNVFGVSSGGISTPYPPTPLSASTSASLFGSPPPASVGGGHGSFLSPSPEPPLSYAPATFVLPAAPTMGMNANSTADPVVTLPSPPSMVQPSVPHELNTTAAAHTGGDRDAASQADSVAASLGATVQRRMSVPSTGVLAAASIAGSESGCLCGGTSGVDTVEILAVVSQLDAARLAVLSQQYSLPCDEIQARFAQTQLALFDQLEEAAAAQLVPPQGDDGTISTQDGALSDHKVSFLVEKGETLSAPMSPTQPQPQGTVC